MRIQPVRYTNYSTNDYNRTNSANINSEPSFKRIGDKYGVWILKSKVARNISKWLYSKDTTNATKHFAVAGSLVTSSAYAYNTMKNKKLEKRNSTTLAINQGLNFFVPTILGYTLDKLISGHTKEYEYSFAGKLQRAMDTASLSADEKKLALERATKQLKGVRTLASIATFTFLYRYLAPVAITKPANRIGEWLGSKIDAKKQRLTEEETKQAA